MAKTIHKVIVTLCHKEISASRIFKLLKEIVGCYGVYKTEKVSKRLVAADQKRCVRTKKLIKKSEKSHDSIQEGTPKTCSRGTCQSLNQAGC